MKALRSTIGIGALLLVLSSASAQVPYCLRVDTGEMVPCYSAEKVDAALAIARRYGSHADRDFVISIEMNRGIFPDAKALAGAVLGR